LALCCISVAWLCITPFGRAAVPDAYNSAASSSSLTAGSSSGASSGGHSCSKVKVPEGASPVTKSAARFGTAR
jgi:hypothetical protein